MSVANISQLSTGQLATLACFLEATAPKVGNVHPAARFSDLGYIDFVLSAIAIGPPMDAAADRPLGHTVLDAIRATRSLVGKNTNLGTVLLIGPLAKVPRTQPLAAGVAKVLSHLTPDDATHVYQAIRLAQPGGLGSVNESDVQDEAPEDLIAAMALAAGRDMVARQYTNHFAGVLQFVAPRLADARAHGLELLDAIVHVQLQTMAEFPDSLIGRKCGTAMAAESAGRARAVLAAGTFGDARYAAALGELDRWLRADGHRRNPGTTADLLAAGLFAALRDNMMEVPISR